GRRWRDASGMNQYRKSAHAVCGLRQIIRVCPACDVRGHRKSIHSFGLKRTDCRSDRIRLKI
ncbi:hypothetical protein SB861_57910, partial [Paraburkholderia sp. SIMBA_049]